MFDPRVNFCNAFTKRVETLCSSLLPLAQDVVAQDEEEVKKMWRQFAILN